MTTKQRAYLRSVASHLDTIFQVGKGGINNNMKTSIADALEAHELIKCRTLDNSEYGPRGAAQEIADAIGAEVVCVIGTKFVLYKESKKNKDISLILKSI